MAKAPSHSLEIEGRKVAISNPAKKMYASGFTKGQVIDYYVRVAGCLLPHLHNRPVTLKRYPNGVEGKQFYQKNAPPSTPEWVQRFAVPRREGGPPIQYVLLNDLASLVWAANLASLELHPLLAAAPEIQRPRAVVFDLDPGEGVDVLGCAQVAFLLKEELAAQGLESFAKVSGSKGLQVYAPLNSPVSYSESQPFAREVALGLERRQPRRIVTEMARSVRAGKVFIDWSQNSDFKTTVSVYSLRAKADRPHVSFPFGWTELRTAIRRGDAARLYLEPEAALQRLRKSADPFGPVLELEQRLPGATRTRLSAAT